MDRKTHINFWYFVLALFGLMLFQQWWFEGRQVETIPYSEFQRFLKNDKIAEIGIADKNIRGKLKQPLSDGRQYIYTVRADRRADGRF